MKWAKNKVNEEMKDDRLTKMMGNFVKKEEKTKESEGSVESIKSLSPTDNGYCSNTKCILLDHDYPNRTLSDDRNVLYLHWSIQ